MWIAYKLESIIKKTGKLLPVKELRIIGIVTRESIFKSFFKHFFFDFRKHDMLII